MVDFNQRTATDMIREYESGIEDIVRKIAQLRKDSGRRSKSETAKLIASYESMQQDMEFALYRLRKCVA